jgi:hypothetical protein
MAGFLELAVIAHARSDPWNALKSTDVDFLIDGVTWTINDVKCMLTISI